jgi:hypothetical protein
MLVFLKKLVLFGLPIALLLSPPSCVLFLGGELTPVDDVIALQVQEKRTVIFGPAYSNPTPYYKLRSILIRRPKVVALGTSRVMQFRSEFFRSGEKFFNAGGAVGPIDNFTHFLAEIPEGMEPDIFIIGLDQYFFNRNVSRTVMTTRQELFINSNITNTLRKNWWKVYRHYVQHRFNLKGVLDREQDGMVLVGFNAVFNRNGFRNDGSYYHGQWIRRGCTQNPDHVDYLFRDSFSRIENGTRGCEWGTEVDEQAVHELKRFLLKCAKRNIYVIGFLTPFPHAVYEKLKSEEDKYQYMFRLPFRIGPAFHELGFRFYDFSDLSTVGASDREVIDGFHCSEKAYMRIAIVMAEQDEVLRKRVDLTFLRNLIQSSSSDLEVVGN